MRETEVVWSCAIKVRNALCLIFVNPLMINNHLWGSVTIPFKEKRVRQSDSLEVKHIVSWKNRVTEAGYILFKGFTTLSSPSIFNAKHSFNRSPNSPLGQPFLSNHSKYSSGKSISTLPAYLPNGICILASLIRFSFSNINEARLRHLTQEYHQRCSPTS